MMANMSLARIRPTDSLPNIATTIESSAGAVLASSASGDILATAYASGLVWNRITSTFTATTTDITMRLINSAPGGGGNDLALDDNGVKISCVAPTAVNDIEDDAVVGDPVLFNTPLVNDSDADGTLEPSSVTLTITGAPAGSTLSGDGKTLTVHLIQQAWV